MALYVYVYLLSLLHWFLIHFIGQKSSKTNNKKLGSPFAGRPIWLGHPVICRLPIQVNNVVVNAANLLEKAFMMVHDEECEGKKLEINF